MLKKITVVFALFVYTAVLIGFSASVMVNQTIGKQEFVQSTLTEANIYQPLRDKIREFVVTSDDFEENELYLAALDKTLTTDTVERLANEEITQFYGYLRGELPEYTPAINIEPLTQQFKGHIESSLIERLESLPECSQFLQPTTTNPLLIECVPPGVPIEPLVQVAVAAELADNELFSQKNIDLTEIADTQQVVGDATADQEIAQAIESNELSTGYQRSQFMPWVAALLAVILGVVAVLLSSSKIKGLRNLAWATITAGLCIIALGRSVLYNRRRLGGSVASGDNTSLNIAAEQVLSITLASMSGILVIIGAIFSALGVIALITSLRIIKKNQPIETPVIVDSQPAPPVNPPIEPPTNNTTLQN